jgi:hypothetical protein
MKMDGFPIVGSFIAAVDGLRFSSKVLVLECHAFIDKP